MKTLDFAEEEELRVNLMKLLEHCPIEACNPENCLLGPVITMKLSDRMRWLNHLNQDSLQFLSSYQFICCEHHLSGQRVAP